MNKPQNIDTRVVIRYDQAAEALHSREAKASLDFPASFDPPQWSPILGLPMPVPYVHGNHRNLLLCEMSIAAVANEFIQRQDAGGGGQMCGEPGRSRSIWAQLGRVSLA